MAKKKPTNFDDFLDEQLQTPEAAAIYLSIAMEENDEHFLSTALSRVVRIHGATKVAAETGIARQALYKMLSENGNPSYKNIEKILDVLGLEIVIREKKKA